MTRQSYFIQASGSPFWVGLAESLSTHFDASLAMLDDRIASDFKDRLPGARIILGNDLKHGLFDRSLCSPIPAHVRQSQAYLKREKEAIYSLDRAGVGGDVGVPDRLLLLSALGDFFWGLFEEGRPSFMIATESPHTFPDLVMHAVAEARQVPVLHFQQNGIIPSIRPVMGNAYEKLTVPELLSPECNRVRQEYLDRYKDKVEVFCSEARKDRLASFEIDFHDRDRQTFSGLKSSWRRFFIPYAYLSEEFLQVRSFLQRNRSLQVEAPLPTHPVVLSGSRTRLAARSAVLAVRQGLALRRLRTALNRLSKSELPERFGVFFLQFEPEKTSLPDGGLFQDQLAAVRNVASSLEGRMKLLVREHPSQLTLTKRGFRVRRPRFYEELARIPNVMLAGSEIDRETLLRGAAVVFTLTGTIGLEARARRIPVIALGHPWYIPLSGIFTPSDDGWLSQAIESALCWSPNQDEEFSDELWSLMCSDSFVTVLNPSAARYWPDAEDDVAGLTELVVGMFGGQSTDVV